MITLVGFRNEGVLSDLLDAKPPSIQARMICFDELWSTARKVELQSDGSLQLSSDRIDVRLTPDQPIYQRTFVRICDDDSEMDHRRRDYHEFCAYLENMDIGAVVMNRPCAGALNHAKLAQAIDLTDFGFLTPPSILSNNPRLIAAFQGDLINKGCSGQRTIAERFSQADMSGRLRPLNPPLLLQRRIRGFDVRAHFVGREYVAIAFETDADDYRYAKRNGFDLLARVCDLPPALSLLCISYMKHERIEFAAFDFVVEEDQWILLEMNPMPGFSYFDQFCGGRISRLLWDALARGYSSLEDVSHQSAPYITAARRPILDRG